MISTRATAGAFAAAAGALIFVLVGPESWPIVLSWLVGAVLIGLIWQRLVPTLRLALAVLLVPLCVLLTWEGGLFFVPSAIALILASLPKRHRAAA